MGFLDKIFPKRRDAHDHHDHGGPEHVDCPKCGDHFHAKADLDAHMKSAHPGN